MELFGVLTDILAVCIASVSIICIYGKWRLSVLRRYGIHGPEPDMFFGNFKQFRRKGYLRKLEEWLARYGNVFGFYIGTEAMILVKDLDMIKEITIKQFQNFQDRMITGAGKGKLNKGILFSKGETWKRQRIIMSPTFSTKKLRTMEQTIVSCADSLAQKFAKLAKSGDIVKVRKHFGRFSLDIIVKIAFGIRSDDPGELFARCEGLKPSKSGARLSFLTLIYPWLTYLIDGLGLSVINVKEYKYILNVINGMLDVRKDGSRTEMKDFLQLLLDAEAVQVQSSGVKTVKKLSHDEVIGQMFMFLIGGHETTASSLGYLAYSLAVNPHVQDRVLQEIQDVLSDETPNLDNVQKLKYLDNVVSEVLRMYPIIYEVTRQTVRTVTINDVTFPKGSNVVVPIYQIHHDPNIYHDPETFNPDRWSTPNERHPMSFMPFGSGPRICIGMKLAMFELKVVVISALRKIRFARAPDTPDKLGIRASYFLYPNRPIKVKLEPR